MTMEEVLRGVARKLAMPETEHEMELYANIGEICEGRLRESGLLRLLEAGQAMREEEL